MPTICEIVDLRISSKPIGAIWSDAELARRNVRNQKLSNISFYIVLFHLSSGKKQNNQTENASAVMHLPEAGITKRSSNGKRNWAWKWIRSLRECNSETYQSESKSNTA